MVQRISHKVKSRKQHEKAKTECFIPSIVPALVLELRIQTPNKNETIVKKQPIGSLQVSDFAGPSSNQELNYVVK